MNFVHCGNSMNERNESDSGFLGRNFQTFEFPGSLITSVRAKSQN